MAYSVVEEKGKRAPNFPATKLVGEYLVDAVGDLTSITLAAPGSIAHTAGYALIWELANDGTTWTAVT